jgi:hypothetical protein
MSTSRDYKVIPSGERGISLATPASSWGYSSYATVIDPLPQGGFITGITFCPDVTDTSLSLDTTCGVLIELYKGGSDTLIAQIPASYRIDTRVAHVQPVYLDFQEPIQIEGGVIVRARVADSVNAVMDAQNSIKVHYYLNNAPTVALNTPSDSATGVSTTPTLEFTGTDAEGDDVRYNTQIDTANTFDSLLGDGPVHDTTVVGTGNGVNTYNLAGLSTSGPDRIILVSVHTSNNATATPSATGLTFTQIGSGVSYGGDGLQSVWRALASSQLSGLVITITSSGNPQSSAVASSFSGCDVSGTNGENAIGNTNTASSSSSSTASASVTTTRNNSLVIGCFGETRDYSITSGTDQTNIGDASGLSFSRAANNKQDSITTSASTSVTNNVTFGSSGPCGGMVIELKASLLPLLNKISGTDSGFANTVTPADTDPFNSGEKADYDVQGGDALTADTLYYWRVRAIDPTGSNTYGEWSSTRSFTVGDAPPPPSFTATPMMHMMMSAGGLM